MKYLITLFLFLAACSAPAQITSYNRVKFYIHPDVIGSTSQSTIRTRLTKYVDDLNIILAKNTGHALTFTPASDVSITTAVPYDGTMPGGGLPSTGYDIRVWVRKSTTVSTYDGSINHHSTGAAVITGTHWFKVNDPDTLPESGFSEYARQIGALLKGIGHIYGVGKVEGELWKMTDVFAPVLGATPMHAFIDQSAFFWQWNTADAYWGPKLDYQYEPMITWHYPMVDRAALRLIYAYSGITSKVIRDNYRYPTLPAPLANLNGLTITLVDKRTCLPVLNAFVQVYRVDNFLPQTSVGLDFAIGGNFSWDWTPANGSVSTDQIRLVHVAAAGYVTQRYYLTTRDLLYAGLYGIPFHQELYLERVAPLAISINPARTVTVTGGVTGQDFELLSSTDLNNWAVVETVAGSSGNNYTYQTPPNAPPNAPPYQFYRVREINGCPVFLNAPAPDLTLETLTTPEARVSSATAPKKMSTVLPPPLPPMPKLIKK